jgi:predicted DNA-binding transcriptional regulator AlpA
MAVKTGIDLGLTAVRGRLLVVAEIAAFLRTSERWVQLHMNDGTFPFTWYDIGERNHAADSCDFDEWLISIRVKAGKAAIPKKSVREIVEGKEVAAVK